MLEGILTAYTDSETHILNGDDSMCYQFGEPHNHVNLTKHAVRFFPVITPQSCQPGAAICFLIMNGDSFCKER